MEFIAHERARSIGGRTIKKAESFVVVVVVVIFDHEIWFFADGLQIRLDLRGRMAARRRSFGPEESSVVVVLTATEIRDLRYDFPGEVFRQGSRQCWVKDGRDFSVGKTPAPKRQGKELGSEK